VQDSQFNFERLMVYQKSLDMCDEAYSLSASFPSSERYNLTSQLQRAAVSVCLNIAEGQGTTDKESNRYAVIAARSVNECIVCITLALRRNYIQTAQSDAMRSRLVEINKMIGGLRKYYERKKQ
jgi:four helix bundle protein